MTTKAPVPVALLTPLAFVNFTIGAGAFCIIGLIGPLTTALSLSKVQAGWIMSAYALGYALSSPVLVSLSGKRPRRDVILTGIVIFVVASVASAFAWNAASLYAARAFAAVGAGLTTPIVAAVAVGASPVERRGTALSIVFSGMTLSQVVGVPAGAYIGYTYGVGATFLTAAAVCVIAAAWLLIQTPRNVPFAPQSLATLGRTLASPPHLVSVLLTVTIAASGYLGFTFLGPLAELRLGMGREGVTLMLVAAGIGAFGGSVFGGVLVDRLGPTRALICSLVGQSIFLPLMTTVPYGLALGLILVLIWNVFSWGFTVPQQARLIALDPAAQGVMLSLNAAGIYLGSGIGSGIAGVVAEHYGIEATGVVGGLLTLLALVHLGFSEWLTRRYTARREKIA